ncbi:MAG TPA: chromate transporter [Methyloceanibacter sp.]|nr:chromate transporter [Methyloceanibacter sp.]
MAQQAVETYGWLSTGEMLDGLGLAETTPGPLILVANSSASWRATAMAANPRSPPGCSAPRSRYGRPSYPASCGSSWARLTWSVSARTPASQAR